MMKRELDKITLWTALITPFYEDGRIDFESLEDLIGRQVESENGLLILGSTGEALNLTEERKISILNFITKLKPQTPIMCGIGGFDLEGTMRWMEILEDHPIDCYLMVTPLYARPGDRGQYEWFKTLMDRSSRPVMLYNIPCRSGISLSLKALEKLMHHDRFWSIKEASGDLGELKKYKKVLGSSSSIFCGNDGLMVDFVLEGGCGLVSVSANVWPKAFSSYVELSLKNKLTSKDIWIKSAETMNLKTNPLPLKALMNALNLIKSDYSMPPLSSKEITQEDLSKLMRAHRDITSIEI